MYLYSLTASVRKDELVNLIRFWLALQIGGWPIKILKGNNFRGIFFSYR